MIGTLQAKRLCLQIDGDVYYRVSAFAEYGRLSQRHLEDMQAGARVEVDMNENRTHGLCLWKAAKPREPAWESPWGPGRPGWHIECSAMSVRHLGATFDIHGGGKDLTFPHHENEIAQSRAATEQHSPDIGCITGFVTIDEEKMSKSVGNSEFYRTGYFRSVKLPGTRDGRGHTLLSSLDPLSWRRKFFQPGRGGSQIRFG